MDSLDDFYEHYHVNLIGLFGIVVLIYVVIFSLFNNTSLNTPEARPWITIVEVFLWILFIVILFLNMKHFRNMDFDIRAFFDNLFGKKPELKIHYSRVLDASQVEQSQDKSCDKKEGEVFHIQRNKYTYEKAKEACELLDARLATYEEVEDSYKNGANWCSYGWSSDQLALFPIQKSMYNELKKIPGHERDCGRIGVNGGHIPNRNAKFGVNCYGKKPFAGKDDLEHMKKFSYSAAYPDAELKKEEKKKKVDKLLIAPFNKDKWNA